MSEERARSVLTISCPLFLAWRGRCFHFHFHPLPSHLVILFCTSLWFATASLLEIMKFSTTINGVGRPQPEDDHGFLI
jgi:hypothetical protein